MRTADALHTAFRALRHNRVRSLLTMLGIVIGIASVILLFSLGTSAERLILDQIRSTGSNLIFVIPGATTGSRFSSPAAVQGIVVKTLNEADALALAREPTIESVSPDVRGQARVIFENNDVTVTYMGVTAEFFAIRNFRAARGAALTKSDVDSLNRAAVLGPSIAKTLFGERDPVGKTIRLKGIAFRVTGVLESKGIGPFGVDQDNLVLIPLSVAQKQLLGIDHYNVISLEASDAYAIDFTKSRVASVLRHNHHIADPAKDDFTIRTQADAVELLGNITGILTAFLTAIAAISLVVGGIGIMNIMLVSVVERTKEIGLRKAVGATNRDILLQFLAEATMLTISGGLVGIALGAGLVILAFVILSRLLPSGWVFALPLSGILLALLVSTVSGLLFGIYPARQAARKDPIEALRYE